MQKKSSLKVFLISFTIFIFLVAAGILSLQMLFPPAKIKAMVIPEIEKMTGRSISVEKVGLSIFPMIGVAFDGIEIGNTARPQFSQHPFVKIKRITAQISLMSIFSRQPEITKIFIQKPDILLQIDSSGSFNFSDIKFLQEDPNKPKQQQKPGLPLLPVPISLKLFAIEDGKIIYDDMKSNQSFIIENMSQAIGFKIDKQLKDVTTTGKLVLEKVSIKTPEITKPLSNLTITLSHDIGANLIDGTAEIKDLRVSLQKIFISMKGTAKNLQAIPELDLYVNSDPIQVEGLLKEIPPEIFPDINKLSSSGTIDLKVNVKGALEPNKPLPINGSLALNQIMVKYTDLPKSINNLNGSVRFDTSNLTIDTLGLLFGQNPISLKASVNNFKKPSVDANLKATVDLSDIKQMVVLPDTIQYSGIVKADINATGEVDPTDPTKLNLQGVVDLNDVKFQMKPLIKPAQVNGKIQLTSKNIAQNLKVIIGQSSLMLVGNVTNYLTLVLPDSTKKSPRPNIDFKITSPQLLVDEFLAPPDTTKKGKVEQTTGPMIAPIPGIDMKGIVTASRLVYQGVEMNNLNLNIAMVNNKSDVTLKSGFSGGSIFDNLQADLTKPNSISFTNKLNVERVEVSDLMNQFLKLYIKPTTKLNKELLEIHKSLFGKINLISSISGSGATPEEILNQIVGDISLKMLEGKIVNTPFSKSIAQTAQNFTKGASIGNLESINFNNLSANFKLQNGKAIIENLKFLSDAGDWNAKGAIGFDASTDITVLNKLTRSVSSQILKVEDQAKSAAKGLLGSDIANSILGNMNLIPRDPEGRVTVKFLIGGTIPKPVITGFGFSSEGASGAQSNQSPQHNLQNQVQQKVDNLKSDAAEKAAQEKARLEAEMRQRAEQEKAALEQQRKAQENQLKQKAADKLKKFF